MTPIPVSDPLHAALTLAAQRHALFSPSSTIAQPVVVAVSGGADSVCLLHALRQVADQWGLALHVAHVNHGLRPAAAIESDFVQALAARDGLPVHVTELDAAALRRDRAGVEAAARRARYTFLCAIARQVTPAAGVPCLAVAHHADDQAETVLLRLLQGSGRRGLGGLRPLSNAPLRTPAGQQPVRLVRPLLAITHAEILAYLARHGLAWLEDESNADLHFTRNRLRHLVLPALRTLNPAITATLCRNAELWAEEAGRLEALDAAALARLAVEPPDVASPDCEPPEPGRVVLDLAAWQALPAADRRGVLRAALAQLGADLRQVGFAHLDEIVRATDPAGVGRVRRSGPHPLPGGLAWSVLGASGEQTARLCLHAAASLPIDWRWPQLGPAWRQAHAALPLPVPGALAAGEWRLAATLLPVEMVPPGWQAGGDAWLLYVDAESLAAAALTTLTPGLRIAPLGMGGRHRRVVDVLRSHKVPPGLRQGWPLLVDCRDGQVLWVCGLQPAESLRITERTSQVVRLHWSNTDGED